MNYLSVENLTKSYGIQQLFSDLSFGIDKGQKVALVARNGAGKSTLMRLLTRRDMPDSGTITYNSEVHLGYLSQDHELNDGLTILENIFSADNARTRAIGDYEQALASGDEKALQRAHDAMDRFQAWDYEARAREVLGKLDIHELGQLTGKLSGGQKRRIALARVLIEQPDLVLLDEPTNHLDLDMIEWLEEFLSQSNMTIFMITHDRYFLENITDEILELENGALYRYKGNFSYYLTKKAEREALESVTRDKQFQLFKKELAWSRTMPQARTTKSKSRMTRFEDLREEVRRTTLDPSLELEINISRMGSKVVELHKVRKVYGETVVLGGFDYVFRTGEKAGLVGRNGTGKTTFLNLLTKNTEPDGGKVVVGDTVVFGYFSQHMPPPREGLRVLECVREVADFIPLTKGKTLTAAQMLERFMFPRNTHSTYVEKLSGGERKRLQLLLVLMKNPNFLILDEPTNDLDVFTLSVLEDYLLQFPGCLLIVSHDRYFLDKLVDHVFVLDGRGNVRDITGSYSTCRAVMNEMEKAGKTADEVKKEVPVTTPAAREKTRLSYKEKLEWEQLEKDIPSLEAEKQRLENDMLGAHHDHQELLTLTNRLAEVMASIDAKTNRWLELSEFVQGA